jgi:hypothetical protein
MRLLVLPLLLAVPLPSSAAPPAPQRDVETAPLQSGSQPSTAACRRPDVILADAPPGSEAKRLGELPDGDLILSVYREVDGCMAPVIVRYGEGRGTASETPRGQGAPAPRVWR